MDHAQTPGDFWSRRRAAVEAEAAAELAASQAERSAQELRANDSAQALRTDAEILQELGLKDPDELVAGDDFAAFMRSAVPERLRRRALRVLWRSNPVLANLDGLLDHGDDFSDAATVVPGLKTAYQVGKGTLRHLREMARQADESAGAADAAADDEGPVIGGNSGASDPVAKVSVEPAETDDTAPEMEIEAAPDPVAPRRRHMRLAFGDDSGRED